MDAATFDLNTASAVELCAECPRLGLFLAEDIVAWRDKHGPFTDTTSLAALVGHDAELAAELAVGLPAATPRRTTLIDGAPPEAALTQAAPCEEEGPPEPVTYSNPWAPPEIADDATAPSRDVVTSVSCEEAPPSNDRSSQTERVEGFRARLAAARALREAVAAANSAAQDIVAEDAQAAAEGVTTAEAPPPADEVDELNADVAPVVDADVVAAAVSQTMPLAEPLPVPSKSLHPPRAERPARRLGVQTIALVGIVLANAGLGFGLASLHRDAQQSRAPIAAMSTELKVLESTQTDTAAELDRTRARLDQQEATLAKTVERMNATAQRQDDAERATEERAERTAKEVDTMNARVNRMERKVDRERYSIDDVLKAIDMAEGSAQGGAPPGSHR